MRCGCGHHPRQVIALEDKGTQHRTRGQNDLRGANPVQATRNLTHARGVDIAIEAVGKPETWEWAVNMVRRGGTVNFFGGCPNESTVNLDTALLHYSEITCKASFHHTPDHVRRALDLVAAGKITAREFVQCEMSLDELPGVLRELALKNASLKTAILP